jgi:hypothetical protein
MEFRPQSAFWTERCAFYKQLWAAKAAHNKSPAVYQLLGAFLPGRKILLLLWR